MPTLDLTHILLFPCIVTIAGGGPAGGAYLRSDGTSYFLRPDGTSYYLRP